MKIDVTVRSPKLALFAAKLSGAGRMELHESMAISVRDLTERHLVNLAQSRQNKFGAPSSDFYKQAAEAVEKAPIDAEAEGATLTINALGLGRAFHDVTITPKSAKALTIPVCALAYNRRARQFPNLFVFKSKSTGTAFLAMRDPGAGSKPILMYLLVRSVTQKQDRSLLPSDRDWEKAAKTGAADYIHSLGN
ncbi:hypothetical protein CfE428DRAFT_5798 [Chthoniobacter flavus Ellin428]|uniref:Uncharacterized protein n=1 Tax=Chthoniobacter flavus Ellin428 TaxID=497964 RepID=B4DA58_9BACT|nr:hypothetical protein [Chthoniobacter flavus]EDY16685.1 hypothetical protein CfE428DRAFT_5798 [Chthoniobacter flavus Ellin428]TCO87258.1 hypothetical protein EV701_12395 [Chthoniobacter flavus]